MAKRRLRGEGESVREEASEAAEVLHLHRDVHLLLSDTECLLHHTLVLQLRQRAGGVDELTATPSRPEPRPVNKDRDTSVPEQTTPTLHTFILSILMIYSQVNILQISKLFII